MRNLLTRPRWVVLSLVVVVIVGAFILLGFWQLRRLDERQLSNAIVAARVDRQPVSVDDIDAAGLPKTDLEFTTIRLAGAPDPERSVFLRSQTHNGVAGSHQLVPVKLVDGRAVLVNVGWVPLGSFPTSVPGLDGNVSIEGLVRASQPRPPLGQEESDGDLLEVRRVDLDRLRPQFPYQLVDFWVQLRSPDIDGAVPHPVEPPALDEGTHLAYAIQWFSFATISVVGFVLLVRRELTRGGARGARGGYVVDDDVARDTDRSRDTH